MKIKKIFLYITFILATNTIVGQELLDLLDKEEIDTPQYTFATFKFSRIAFGHSIETRKKGTLDVFVANRFWNTPEDVTQSFVSDRLSSRIGLEYGISDRFLMGFGGTTFDGLFDGFLKYKLIKQRSDKKGSPFSVSILQSASYFSEALVSPTIQDDFSDRMSFTSQLLISKKISSNFSIQLTPSFIHNGIVLSEEDPQNHFAIGIGGRFKLGNHVSMVSEYYYTTNPIESFDTYKPFALGVNWELGDVMLQFMLTNTRSMVENSFITNTRNNFNFKDPNLHFGFNMTYVFHFKRGLKNNSQNIK